VEQRGYGSQVIYDHDSNTHIGRQMP